MAVSDTAVPRQAPESQHKYTRANREWQNPSSRTRCSRGEDGKILWTFAHTRPTDRHMLARNCAPTEGNCAQSRNLRCNICQPGPQTNLHAVSFYARISFCYSAKAKRPFRFAKILKKETEKRKKKEKWSCKSIASSESVYWNLIDEEKVCFVAKIYFRIS